VQPAQNAARGSRHICLHEAQVETRLGKLLRVETLVKISTRVPVHDELDDDATEQRSLNNPHSMPP